MIHELKVRKRAPHRIEGSQTLQELVDSLGKYAEKTAFLTLTKHDRGAGRSPSSHSVRVSSRMALFEQVCSAAKASCFLRKIAPNGSRPRSE